MSFLTKYNILNENQFGFRSKRSTVQAIVQVVEYLRDSMEQNDSTSCLFIDLTKAFDTVDHQILLNKLEIIGIRGKILELLCSYLSNRKQYVQIQEQKSTTEPISYGVPQGSIFFLFM